MARRTLYNIDECIIKAVIKIGANEGIGNVTARKIADCCDITDATVFVYFQNKQNLLLQAYLYVCEWTNNVIDIIIENSLLDNTLTGEKWEKFFVKLVENVDKAKYFCGYRYSGKNVHDIKPSHKQIEICKKIVTKGNLTNTLSNSDYAVVWGSLMESIAYYVIQVADGRMANSLGKYELIRELIFGGFR
ncbi:MAG TPA: helix-turn-helix domain-containing protein [Clostridia bacterium]|nr:helix-turn-helix domain-containing protein [Clostridia bacterium]